MLKTWLFGEPPGNPVRTNAFVVAISGTTVFAEFETNLRRERQLEGIAKAKAAGAYKGWPPEGVGHDGAFGMAPHAIAQLLWRGKRARRRTGSWSANSPLSNRWHRRLA
jgi:hypothetical protein